MNFFFLQNKYTTTICKNTLGIEIKREKNMSILCEGMLGEKEGGGVSIVVFKRLQ